MVYKDDFVLLVADRHSARACLRAIRAFLTEELRLELNPRRVLLGPLRCPRDVLGYVHHPDGRARVRRRSVRRLWRRLPALAARSAASPLHWPAARASVASWFGLAQHANAVRLSRAIFTARDVRNIGKRMVVRTTHDR